MKFKMQVDMKTKGRVKGNEVHYDPEHPERTRFEADPNGTMWAFGRECLSFKEKLRRIWNVLTDK